MNPPYVLPGTTEKLTMSLIAECVADFYGQDARTIFENKSRKSDYLHPRQLVQAVLVFFMIFQFCVSPKNLA